MQEQELQQQYHFRIFHGVQHQGRYLYMGLWSTDRMVHTRVVLVVLADGLHALKVRKEGTSVCTYDNMRRYRSRVALNRPGVSPTRHSGPATSSSVSERSISNINMFIGIARTS